MIISLQLQWSTKKAYNESSFMSAPKKEHEESDKSSAYDPMKKDSTFKALQQKWIQERKKIQKGERTAFISDNKLKLEKALSNIYQNNSNSVIYRFTNALLISIAVVAGWVDMTKDALHRVIALVPAPRAIKSFLESIFNAVRLKAIVEFFRAKLYSLRRAPHDIAIVNLFDDIISRSKKEGLDVKKYFPDFVNKFERRKLQFLQHSFFKEFSKSKAEKILAMPFRFERSLSPVLPDTALWHKFFVFLENRNIADLILIEKTGKRISFKNSPKHTVASSYVVKTLYEASVLKAAGKRVFVVGHHEGYIGPYLVRSVLRRLGFDNLAGNCNTVVGPRMFSNIVLKNGASNVGNLFLTLPSQKTTEVKELELAEELLKTGRRSQGLIKMPNSLLAFVEGLEYDEFMERFINCSNIQFEENIEALGLGSDKDLMSYLHMVRDKGVLNELHYEDYCLFKQVMYEPFLIFPEGSRSYIDKNGGVTLKYVSPRFLDAYFRPGDVILPISLVGGSDIGNSWRLKPALIGLSVGDPIEVNKAMIEEYDLEAIEIMKKIAKLPNIKSVSFCESIQAGNKLD